MKLSEPQSHKLWEFNSRFATENGFIRCSDKSPPMKKLVDLGIAERAPFGTSVFSVYTLTELGKQELAKLRLYRQQAEELRGKQTADS